MTDPTLQTSGSLSSLLRINSNWTSLNGGFESIAIGDLDFTAMRGSDGPPNTPGIWTPGDQFLFLAPNSTIPSFIPPNGYTETVRIMDMSPATVLPGKTYALSFNVLNDSNWIQLYFVLTGSADGTTVLPGFGLWSLSGTPQAWTYVTPAQFTGAWEIELLSPSCAAPVLLSVEYAPPRTYGAPTELAKLVFTVDAGSVSQPLSIPSQSLDTNLASQLPGSGADGIQHIHRASEAYVMHT